MKSIQAEIRALEKRIAASSALDMLGEGIKKTHDALHHLDNTPTVQRMKEDLHRLESDHEKFMLEIMDTVEPLG